MLDDSAQKSEDETMERVALHHKVDRHEGWIKTIAKKTDVVLADA